MHGREDGEKEQRQGEEIPAPPSSGRCALVDLVALMGNGHDDGKLTSARLYVEKDGVKPPM
jgi:hypothetical protein